VVDVKAVAVVAVRCGAIVEVLVIFVFVVLNIRKPLQGELLVLQEIVIVVGLLLRAVATICGLLLLLVVLVVASALGN